MAQDDQVLDGELEEMRKMRKAGGSDWAQKLLRAVQEIDKAYLFESVRNYRGSLVLSATRKLVGLKG